MDFETYLNDFERRVIVRGVRAGILGVVRKVTLRPNKFDSRPFGRKMGRTINTAEPLVIDYYGYLKKSDGLLEWAARERGRVGEGNRYVGSATVPLVFFNAIRFEQVVDLSADLIVDFPRFKAAILAARGWQRKAKEHAREIVGCDPVRK